MIFGGRRYTLTIASFLLLAMQHAFCFDAYYTQVTLLFKKGKYPEALSLLKKLDSSSSVANKDELLYIKCVCLEKIGSPDQAKKELNDLAAKYQSSSYAPKALKLEADLITQPSERKKIHFQIMKYYPSSDEGTSLLTEYINSTFRAGDFLTCETLLKALASSKRTPQEQWATYMLTLVSNISNQAPFSASQVQGLYSIVKKETNLKNYNFAQKIIKRLATSNQLLTPDMIGYWAFLCYKDNSKTSITSNATLALSKMGNEELAIAAQTFISLNFTLERKNLNTYVLSQIIQGREGAVLQNPILCQTITNIINSSKKLSYEELSGLYEILTKAPNSNPETGKYFYDYGVLQTRNGEGQKAILTFQKALFAASNNSTLQTQINQQLVALKRNQGVKSVSLSDESGIKSVIALADSEYQKGNFTAAKSKYSEAISKMLSPCPSRFDLSLKLAHCVAASGATGEALWRYAALYNDRLSPSKVAAEAANSALRIKIYQQNSDKYNLFDLITSRGVQPDDDLKFLLGVNLLLDKNNLKAFQIFTQLSSSHTNLSESARRIASICTNTTLPNFANQAISQALLTEIGNISGDLPALAQGILNIVQSRAGNILSDIIMFRQAELYLNAENVQGSLPLFQRIATNFPSSDFAPESLIRIAIIKTGFQGRPSEGDMILKTIIEKYPKSPQASLALFYRASLALWRNENGKARAFFNQVIEQYPSSREVSFAKASLAQMH